MYINTKYFHREISIYFTRNFKRRKILKYHNEQVKRIISIKQSYENIKYRYPSAIEMKYLLETFT